MSKSDENSRELDFEAQMLELSDAYERQQSGNKLSGSVAGQLDAISAAQTEMLAALGKLSGQPGAFDKVASRLDASAHKTDLLEKSLASLTDEIKKKNALESSNEKLFEAMHQELRSYKDGFLFDALQRPIVQDLIHLLDDLELLSIPLEEAVEAAAGSAGADLAPVSNNLLNSIHFLVEILSRLGVEQVVEVENYDKRIHRAIEVQPTDNPDEDGRIIRIHRAGYRWRDRLLRPVDVIISRHLRPGTVPEPASEETASPENSITNTGNPL